MIQRYETINNTIRREIVDGGISERDFPRGISSFPLDNSRLGGLRDIYG